MPPSPAETLLIFDLDNTLVHSRIDFRGLREQLIATLRAVGATVEPDEVLARRPIPHLVLIGEEHDRTRGASITAGMWQTILEYESAGMAVATIEDGAGEVLARLRTLGHPLSVLTNNAREATLASLEQFSLRAYFDLVVTRDDVPALKPAPDGVRHAMDAFADRTRAALVIGDSWIDGAAARDAGAAFLAFQPRPNDLESRGIQPAAIAQRLQDLESLDVCSLAAGRTQPTD
jgi:phosphoglycolate phosphatase